MASPILSIDGIATQVSDTSNNISNRITDLYTKDITFQENVNVSGDLKVEGTTVTIKTDTYTTETLEIVNTASITNSTLLKINQTKNSGNIIEVLNDSTNVIIVDNSGNMTTTGAIDIRQDPSGGDFLPEKRYPPRGMTGLTDNISGQDYGNGLYEVSAASSDSSSSDFSIYNAFYARYASQDGAYIGGVYQFANYIVPGYLGEWIKLKLPVPIKLTKYGFTNITPNLPERSPGQYKIYGSNDNVNWTVLVHKTSTITYTANVFEESITTNGTYKYIALVVNKILGPDDGSRLHFDKFAIYGQEVNKKFSVDASDGSGYFAGDLQVNGNITTTGTINGGGSGGGGGKVYIIPTVVDPGGPGSPFDSSFDNKDLSNVSTFAYDGKSGIMFRIYGDNNRSGFIAEGIVWFNDDQTYSSLEILYQGENATNTKDYNQDELVVAKLLFSGNISSLSMIYEDRSGNDIKIEKIIFL